MTDQTIASLGRLEMTDYKAHRITSIDFGPITILVGPNGSGKSTVLEALEALGSMANKSPSAVFGGSNRNPSALARRSTNGFEIAATSVGLGNPHRVVSRATMTTSKETGDVKWNFGLAEHHLNPDLKRGGDPEAARGDVTLRSLQSKRVGEIFAGARSFRFVPQTIAFPASDIEANPMLGIDGSNAALVLTTMKLQNDTNFKAVEDLLRRVVPQVQRLSVKRVQHPRINGVGYEIFFDFPGAAEIPAANVSEGTLIMLALAIALHEPNAPRLVLLDDLAHALHPTAQLQLVDQLKTLTAQRTDLQIVGATHSPFVLDRLEPSDVVAFALNTDGTVVTKHLSEHPDAKQVRGSLTTGQLWSLDPEQSWVLRG